MAIYKTTSFRTTGIQTWIVPERVTTIVAEAWGAGGNSSTAAEKNGGGGGAYARVTLTVTPGQTITIQPAALTNSSSYVQIDGANMLIAASGSDATSTLAGTGGLASSSVGTVKYNGGNGDAVNGYGGGTGGRGGAGGNATSTAQGLGGIGGALPEVEQTSGGEGTAGGLGINGSGGSIANAGTAEAGTGRVTFIYLDPRRVISIS